MAVFIKLNNSGHQLDSIRSLRHLSIICYCRLLNHNLDHSTFRRRVFEELHCFAPKLLHLFARSAASLRPHGCIYVLHFCAIRRLVRPSSFYPLSISK